MRKSAELLADEVRRVAAQKIKHSTGNYINNVVITEDINGGLSVSNIARDPITGHYYGRDLEYGTKYNGRGYIYPKQSSVLRIPTGNGMVKLPRENKKGEQKIYGDPNAVYVRRIKGQKGYHIFRTAARNIARRNGFKYNKIG